MAGVKDAVDKGRKKGSKLLMLLHSPLDMEDFHRIPSILENYNSSEQKVIIERSSRIMKLGKFSLTIHIA